MFSSSAEVVIGQGKIADSEVTLEVSTINVPGGPDREIVKKTYTYKKEYVAGQSSDPLSKGTFPIEDLDAVLTVTPVPTSDLHVNFGAEVSSPQYMSRNITLEALAGGGTGVYAYEFYIDDVKVQSASLDNTYQWKNDTAGTHKVKVIVTDTDGNRAVSEKEFVLELDGMVLIVTPTVVPTITPIAPTLEPTATPTLTPTSTPTQKPVEPTKKPTATPTQKPQQVLQVKSLKTSIKSNKAHVDNTIRLTATAAGETGTLKYQFTYKYNGKTKVIKSYSTKNTANFKPEKAGKYTLTVHVKDASGKVVSKSVKSYKVKEKLGVKKVAITYESGKLKIKTTVQGAEKNVKCKYVLKKNGKKIKATSYKSNKTATFKNVKKGKYSITVYVQDSTKKVAKKTISYKIK